MVGFLCLGCRCASDALSAPAIPLSLGHGSAAESSSIKSILGNRMKNKRKSQQAVAASLVALLSGAAAAQQGERQLATIQVQAQAAGEDGYQADVAASATKIKAPLKDVPQTVNVVTEKLIEDQAAQSLQEVLRNVPGVSAHIGDGQRDQFYIRGFDAIGDQFVDGLRDDALYYRDLSNVERVEVVKGPAAVLYGRGSSGGIVNRITKKPTATAIREAEFTLGSFDQKRATIDLSQPVNETLRLRLVGAAEEAGSFRDQGFLRRGNLAASASFNVSADTQLLVQGEQLNDRRVTDMGIPAYRGRPAPVDIATYYGTNNARQDDYSDAEVSSGRIKLEHRISPGLTLSNHFGAYDYRLDRQNTFGQTVNDSTGVVTLFHGKTHRHDEGWFNQLELTQKLSTGAVGHQILYGFEVGQQDKDLQVYNWNVKPTTSVLNPVNPPLSAFGAPVKATDNLTRMDVQSLYVQDMLTFSPRWKALVGLRHDKFDQAVEDRMTASRRRTDKEWSPRGGLVFQPNGWQSYYVSYSRSFQPSGEVLAFTSAQSQMAPEMTRNLEAGVKLDLFGGKTSATAAVFELERTNIKNVGPGGVLIPVGEQRTRGLEFSLAGEVARGWQVSAGYAYLDAVITKSATASMQGKRAALTPRNSANLWLMRELGGGFKLGGGLNYVGDRYAAPDNLVTLESYLTADAALIYQTKAYDLALNLKNLSDEKYFVSGHGASNNLNMPGAPRSVQLTGRIRF